MKLPFYTHAGFFHADEVTAFAIASMAGVVDSLNRLTDLKDIPTDGIVADIGREYTPERLRFDHHQGIIRRENGYPYASAGMLWEHYGEIVSSVYAHSKHKDVIKQHVDDTLIQGIDAHDADNAYQVTATCSGGKVRPVTISHIIAGMNGDASDHFEQQRLFLSAAAIVKGVIISHVQSAEKHIEAAEKFKEVAVIDGPVITLAEGLPWREIVHERHPEALFVISPSNHPGNPWSMTAVTVKPESREVKCPIERPDWFAGFIHQGKWIAGADNPHHLKKLAEYCMGISDAGRANLEGSVAY